MLRTTIGVLIAMLVAGCYAAIAQPHGFNQLSRFDMLYALSNEGRFTIDTLWHNTQDVGVFNGQHFSDKPPGVTYLALPAYTLTLGAQRLLGQRPTSEAGISTALWTTTLATSVLLAALGAMAMWTLLCSYGCRPRHALLATLACWLGTLAFPYGSMLFSHTPVIGLLSIAMAAMLVPVAAVQRHSVSASWWQAGIWLGGISGLSLLGWVVIRLVGMDPAMRIAILNVAILSLSASMLLMVGTWRLLTGQGGASERRRREVLIGIAFGLAVLCEFMAAIPVAALWLVFLRRDWKRALRTAAWAMAPLLLLPFTNWLCFDSPFTLGYSTNAFLWMREGFFGITLLPNPSALFLLLFSGGKGLLFWSPCMALAIPGFRELYARNSALCLAIGGSAALLTLFIATTGNPGGGMAVGPRYLAPVIPLLILPMVLGLQIVPRLGTVLIALSILFNAIAAIINPMPSPALSLPLTQYYIPELLRGNVLNNAGSWLGLPPVLGLLPLLGFAAALLFTLWRMSGALQAKRTIN